MSFQNLKRLRLIPNRTIGVYLFVLLEIYTKVCISLIMANGE